MPALSRDRPAAGALAADEPGPRPFGDVSHHPGVPRLHAGGAPGGRHPRPPARCSSAGLIEYHRGALVVLDRAGLEAAACGCYAEDRRAYASPALNVRWRTDAAAGTRHTEHRERGPIAFAGEHTRVRGSGGGFRIGSRDAAARVAVEEAQRRAGGVPRDGGARAAPTARADPQRGGDARPPGCGRRRGRSPGCRRSSSARSRTWRASSTTCSIFRARSTGKLRLERSVVDLRDVIERGRRGLPAGGRSGAASAWSSSCLLTPLEVEGDPVRLAQVVGNLLDNASKFTPDGGAIELLAAADGDARRPERGRQRHRHRAGGAGRTSSNPSRRTWLTPGCRRFRVSGWA